MRRTSLFATLFALAVCVAHVPAHAQYTAIILNPVEFIRTEALGVAGGQQVGRGDVRAADGSVNTHALLWSGSAASVVDLDILIRNFDQQGDL
jgi:hypothetical protein